MSKLKGRVAVITGGTEGIGLATAKLFVKEGAYVFITGRRPKELGEAVKAIGDNAAGVQGDVSNLADLDRLYETIAKAKRRIDIVVANAGLSLFAPFGKVTEEHFDKLFDINVKGTLFTVQKALPLLNDGGSIIITGSFGSVKGTPNFGVYGASKAALRSFVRTWTTDLKDRHIRSNVLSPGPIKTPQIDRQPPEAIARMVSTVPMGRMGQKSNSCEEKQDHVKSTYSCQAPIRYDPRAMRGLLARRTCSPLHKSTRREALCAPLHSVLHYRRSASRSEFGRHRRNCGIVVRQYRRFQCLRQFTIVS